MGEKRMLKRNLGVVLVAVMVLCFTSNASAVPPQGPPGQNKGGEASAKQGQLQGQAQGQAQGQGQGQIGINKSSNKNSNKNAQGQGQIGINEAVGQGNTTTTNLNTDQETTVYAPTWAPTPSTQGKEESKVYSIWGGIDTNELSRDVRTDHQIKTLKLLQAENIIDAEQYANEMIEVYESLEFENNRTRFLGFLWKTKGRHLGNLFGILAMDDFRAGKNKLTYEEPPAKPVVERTEDSEIDGNAGYVN